MSQGESELKVLLQESQELSSEMQARYAHHYHFHYLVLLVVGALAAAFVALPVATSSVMLLAVPAVMSPLILLMLKEHAYMDLR